MREKFNFIVFSVIFSLIIERVSTASTIPCTQKSRSTQEILDEFRHVMVNTDYVEEPIQAYIIPAVDAHQSEYPGQRDRRIQFISGFSGSNGMVVVTDKEAVLWADSRYHIQASQQLNQDYWTVMKSGLAGVPTRNTWLLENLPVNSTVGFDPFLMTPSEYRSLFVTLEGGGIRLVSITRNLVDIVWGNDRPPRGDGPIVPHTLQFTGRSASNKVEYTRDRITALDGDSLVVSQLDDIGWLLNLRGTDILYTPVFYSYVILTQDNIYFYVDADRITTDINNHFNSEGIQVTVGAYDDILNGISRVLNETTGNMIISTSANLAIYRAIPINRLAEEFSPISLTKPIKNHVEAQGMEAAHIRDSVAIIRYLHWLEENVDTQNITELSGSRKVGELRSEGEHFRGLSFTAISAVGANAAMAHYSPMEETDTRITRDEIYMLDSGGQYLDGTTDITRTIHLGNPTEREIECFTRVLKGFMAMHLAVFPSRATLSFFDALARQHLWQIGLDYGHGTGHGVGSFMGVHEYPPLISTIVFENPYVYENMFTSTEPGYYEENEFGMRIEDVVQVVSAENIPNNFGGRGAYRLKTVTYVPIQAKLINTDLITPEEAAYLNQYHQNIRNVVIPILRANESLSDVADWLMQQTEPIVSTKYNK